MYQPSHGKFYVLVECGTCLDHRGLVEALAPFPVEDGEYVVEVEYVRRGTESASINGYAFEGSQDSRFLALDDAAEARLIEFFRHHEDLVEFDDSDIFI